MSFEHENEERPEREISPEEFLAERRRSIRRKSFWAVGLGAVLSIVSVAATWALVYHYPEALEEAGLEDKSFVAILFRNIVFLLGLFFLAGGIWGIFHAKNLRIEDYIATPEAVEFLESVRDARPYYSLVLVGAIVVVFLVQMLVDSQNPPGVSGFPYSIDRAGFSKPLFRQGEWWRILTGGALHGGFLHIYFNGQAFYGLGSTIEYLSNRAHLALIFLLAVIGGGFLSLILMPTVIPSVGASGGILGLIGYLAVYGYRRQKHLPPNFLKSMLINIGFIAAFGIVGYQFIDNFAHLGGLLVGVVYGFLQIPRDLKVNPRETNFVIKILGAASLAIFIGVCVFTILRLLKVL